MSRARLIPRRRCRWCMVPLRWWQRGYCRRCRGELTGNAGIYLQSGGPSYRGSSRWHDEPDRFFARRAR